jgi:AraC-like DNA-binding protein
MPARRVFLPDRPRAMAGTSARYHNLAMDLDPWAPTEPLGDALHALRMSGAFYCHSELRAPWGLSLPPMPGYMWFHVVTSGRAWLKADGDGDVSLGPGDVALVPLGQGHGLRSEPAVAAPSIHDLPRELITERYEVLRHGGAGPLTHLICAAVRLGNPAAFDLVAAMPRTIIVPAPDPGAADGIHTALRLIAAEARSGRPGGQTVLTRLADVLVVEAIRGWIDGDPETRTGWLGALRNPQIGRALAAIHRNPGRSWTVQLLARDVAMSRSAFAAQFTQCVGMPPMGYLARWRMNVAIGWLSDRNMTASEVAHRLGYQSEAAFNRAFKRLVGVTPGSLRANPERAQRPGHQRGRRSGPALR